MLGGWASGREPLERYAEGSRRGMSWGDAARSSWSGMMGPGEFPRLPCRNH